MGVESWKRGPEETNHGTHPPPPHPPSSLRATWLGLRCMLHGLMPPECDCLWEINQSFSQIAIWEMKVPIIVVNNEIAAEHSHEPGSQSM